jgi:hypothetical protein
VTGRALLVPAVVGVFAGLALAHPRGRELALVDGGVVATLRLAEGADARFVREQVDADADGRLAGAELERLGALCTSRVVRSLALFVDRWPAALIALEAEAQVGAATVDCTVRARLFPKPGDGAGLAVVTLDRDVPWRLVTRR